MGVKPEVLITGGSTRIGAVVNLANGHDLKARHQMFRQLPASTRGRKGLGR